MKNIVISKYAVVSMPEGRKSLPMPSDEDEYGDIAQVGDDEDDEI